MAKRVDANQSAIVEALRAIGASVECGLSKVGHGCPDLAIGINGHDFVAEVKNGDARLTPAEEKWRANWKGTYLVFRDPEEAVKTIRFLSGLYERQSIP